MSAIGSRSSAKKAKKRRKKTQNRKSRKRKRKNRKRPKPKRSKRRPSRRRKRKKKLLRQACRVRSRHPPQADHHNLKKPEGKRLPLPHPSHLTPVSIFP